MTVVEIKERIKPLSDVEKLELFRFLEKELERAEILEHTGSDAVHEVSSPYGQYAAAQQLEEHFKQGQTIRYHGPVNEPKIAQRLTAGNDKDFT